MNTNPVIFCFLHNCEFCSSCKSIICRYCGDVYECSQKELIELDIYKPYTETKVLDRLLDKQKEHFGKCQTHFQSYNLDDWKSSIVCRGCHPLPPPPPSPEKW